VSADATSSEVISAPAKASFFMAILPCVDAAMRAALIVLYCLRNTIGAKADRPSAGASVVPAAIGGQYRHP
jgi:hypothetical protein